MKLTDEQKSQAEIEAENILRKLVAKRMEKLEKKLEFLATWFFGKKVIIIYQEVKSEK